MSRDIEVRKIVLLPRYTSFSGAQTFRGAPLNVRAFASATLNLWVGSPIGTSAGFSLAVQESPDLETWSLIQSLTPTPGTESTANVQFTMEWLRLVVALVGTDPAFTGWCVGDFVTRVRRG